jgi:hypothetical protein
MDDPRVEDGSFAGVAKNGETASPLVEPDLGARVWVVAPPLLPRPAIVYGPPEDPVALSRKPPAGWQELDRILGTPIPER